MSFVSLINLSDNYWNSISISAFTSNIKLKMKWKEAFYTYIRVTLVIETSLIFDRDMCHRVLLFFFRRMSHICNLPRISATKNRRRAKDGQVGHSTCGPSNWSKNHRPARCNKIYGDTTVKTYPRYFTKYHLKRSFLFAPDIIFTVGKKCGPRFNDWRVFQTFSNVSWKNYKKFEIIEE